MRSEKDRLSFRLINVMTENQISFTSSFPQRWPVSLRDTLTGAIPIGSNVVSWMFEQKYT